MQREASYFEMVSRRLSAAARMQQDTEATLLSAVAAAMLLPVHLLTTLVVSSVKLAWTSLLAVTFLLPAMLRPPVAVCVCSVLLYAVYLRQVTLMNATGVAGSLVAFIFLPALVRALTARLLATPRYDPARCTNLLFRLLHKPLCLHAPHPLYRTPARQRRTNAAS